MAKLSNLFSESTLSANLSYFDYECVLGRQALVPWLRRHVNLAGLRVGDFGCHQGGVLQVLREDCAIGSGVGFDLNRQAIATSPLQADDNFYLQEQDILTFDPQDYPFDLVLFRDSLEHIPSYFEALAKAKACLPLGGHIFVSFPPYYSPFGGHQQYANNSFKLCPYVHYLPSKLFFGLIQCEDNAYMSAAASKADLRSIRKTRLTLGKLEKAARRLGLAVAARNLFLLRPAFKVRYGLPILQAPIIGDLPVVREVVVMGAYYLLGKQ
ncbi:MAG: methyltransferase domain-containing protein [Leptolyngbya sp. DLM2.Bin27]|nr:MAG: methyltransferase domain-containing protein [Leptolyngbya sp. DLM2.Bin27]